MMYGAMTGTMWIWPVLIVAGLLILGYLAVRLTLGVRPDGRSDPPASARQILDERNARGEIDDEEL
ncbi:MAG: putative rane protein [Actinoplanes sp.]|jgi:putative membrane protein|nr:putative rane protein [Actinoplanes sp.]